MGLEHAFSSRTDGTLASATVGPARSRRRSEGEQFEATAGLRHLLDSTGPCLCYAYQDNRFDPGTRTHTFLGRVGKEFSPRVAGDLSSVRATSTRRSPPYRAGRSSAVPASRSGGSGPSSPSATSTRATRPSCSAAPRRPISSTRASARTLSRRVFLAAYAYYHDSRTRSTSSTRTRRRSRGPPSGSASASGERRVQLQLPALQGGRAPPGRPVDRELLRRLRPRLQVTKGPLTAALAQVHHVAVHRRPVHPVAAEEDPGGGRAEDDVGLAPVAPAARRVEPANVRAWATGRPGRCRRWRGRSRCRGPSSRCGRRPCRPRPSPAPAGPPREVGRGGG